MSAALHGAPWRDAVVLLREPFRPDPSVWRDHVGGRCTARRYACDPQRATCAPARGRCGR